MPTYQGSCHCGAVRIEVSKDEPISRLLDCNCSICAKKGILHTPVPDAELSITVGADDLVLYQFGSSVAEHKFCRYCGIHVIGRPRNAPERHTVNARCLDQFAQLVADIEIVKFNGHDHPKDCPKDHPRDRA